MTEIIAHKASVGPVGVDAKIARNLGRIARLQDALAIATTDERKAAIEAEISALDASFGGRAVREALAKALAEELERTRPEREKAIAAAELGALEKRVKDLRAAQA